MWLAGNFEIHFSNTSQTKLGHKAHNNKTKHPSLNFNKSFKILHFSHFIITVINKNLVIF